MRLADIAPRLALARDQRLAEIEAEYRREIQIADERLRLQRLVAHRDLQMVRSLMTDSGRYIAVRQRKLRAAMRALERLDRRAA